MNTALLVWEIEDKYEGENEQFKQSMVQAFPQLYEEIYNLNSSSDSLDGYEQILPQSEEEYQTLTDFLASFHTGSAEELIGESDG